MSRRKRQIVVTVVLAAIASVVGVISYASYRFNEVDMKSLKTMSNIAQSNGALQQYLTDNPRWTDEHLDFSAASQVALDRGRAADLLRAAAAVYGADPAVPDDVSLDAWRRPLRVTFWRDPAGPVHFRIESLGYDGLEGTADDVIYSSERNGYPSTHPY